MIFAVYISFTGFSVNETLMVSPIPSASRVPVPTADFIYGYLPENTDTTVPKIENASSFSSDGAFNDYALEDGSYLRLKALTIGYNLNNNWKFMKQLHISQFRISATLNNVFTITKYSGLDPEIAAGSPSAFGIDTATYPTNERRFTFGINLTF